MAKRQYPTKTDRSRQILGDALTAYQAANPEASLETALKAVRRETTKRFESELDMTPECANTYFQNRKKEMTSALAATAVSGSTSTDSVANAPA